MMNEPILRPSSPQKSGLPKNVNKYANNDLTGNQRLRSAASFSPYNNPTSMAVRLSRCGVPSLAAVAGPMGINIVDLATPQRSLLVLNYSSSPSVTGVPSNNGGISVGGITSMAFQPDQSIVQNPNSGASDSNGQRVGATWREHSQSSSPILLATARGSGILIWDCSGRALSPLLGRLNAADSWTSSAGPTIVQKRRSTAKGDDAAAELSDPGIDQIQPPPLVASSPASVSGKTTLTAAAAKLETIQTPISLERNTSYQSYQNQGNSINKLFTSKGNVTSLAWKGPTVPILISTVGNSVCMYDLRTSLFAGVERMKGGGARPNSRFFVSPHGGTLIHCAYSYDESQHMFSTLDSAGVVTIWDDRKAGNGSRCLASFVACSQGGVGIASMPPSKKNGRGGDGFTEARPRWVTWGMDSQANEDDLVVKVWSPSTAVTADTDNVDDAGTAIAGQVKDPYQVTSLISIPNAVAARVHPTYPDAVLVFKTSPSEKETSVDRTSESLMHTLEGSPEWRAPTCRSPEMAAVISTPPSPPPLMLQDYGEEVKNNENKNTSSPTARGWEAELWRIVADPDLEVKSETADMNRDANGAQMISSFRGGYPDEDALSFAPGRSEANSMSGDVIAVDLALGIEAKGSEHAHELQLCTLTNSGQLRVFGIPEVVDEASVDDKKEVNSMSNVARVYRGRDDVNMESSSWWKGKNEEDEEEEAVANASPQKDTLPRPNRENSTQFDIELTSPFEETTIDARNNPIISEDASRTVQPTSVTEDMDVSATRDVVQHAPIDPLKASRVPCPPLCGAAFSAGGAGGLVTFTNGPVKRMFAWYNSSDKKLGNSTSLSGSTSPIVADIVDDNGDELSRSGDRQRNQKLPRTVFDLLEMQSEAKIAQWGDGNDNNDTLNEDDASGSSDDSSSYEDVEVVLESDSSDSENDGFFHVSKAYKAYFSDSRKSLLGEDSDNESNIHKDDGGGEQPKGSGDTSDANKNFAGLSSISPAIAITRKYTDLVLNGHTPELANRLQLGDCWWLASDFSIPSNVGKNIDGPGANRQENNKPVKRNNSNPDFPYSPNRPSGKSLERTWSLQPQPSSNKQTSMMGNLKKLMLPGMATPPDQRLIEKKNKHESAPRLETSTAQSKTQKNETSRHPLGVYLLENPQTPDAAAERLSITRNLCIQNAQVCIECGQKTKFDTWILLAKTIESLEIFESDPFAGWGGASDALTTGVVTSVLEYYESQADYQMLATIVCVLTFGRDRRKSSKAIGPGKEDDYQLLPKFDERRYDMYLHHYAALLYGWGCLTVRNEISKRLAYGVPGAGGEIITGVPGNEEKGSSIVANTGVATGVTFTPICQKCMTPVDDTNNVCRKCKDYSFQCSICCMAVRGACTWCPMCSHGGHADHMMAWFEEHQMCPTGCGCLCVERKASRFSESIAQE
ncbi:hypothetical protein ACHAWC_008345 [Mediolabrus comicus]